MPVADGFDGSGDAVGGCSHHSSAPGMVMLSDNTFTIRSRHGSEETRVDFRYPHPPPTLNLSDDIIVTNTITNPITCDTLYEDTVEIFPKYEIVKIKSNVC